MKYPCLIDELFTPFEAGTIKSIPLSHRPSTDRYVWHFDKHGKYNVKSGYRVARNKVTMNFPSSSSDTSAGTRSFSWNKLWRVSVPPKVHAFMWRMIRGILPTRKALMKRLLIPDSECVFCNCCSETDRHLFGQCEALWWFWHFTPFGTSPCKLTGNSLQDWILDLLESLDNHQTELLFMCCWVIWGERNKLVWNGGTFNPQFMASSTGRLLEEYQRYHPVKTKNKGRPISHWETPPSGRLKINIDGAFHLDSGLGGIGVIVRNEMGICVAAYKRPMPFCSSAMHAETEACRDGLNLALQHGWDNFILETDCSALITTLDSLEVDLSEVGRIIGDCKDILGSLSIVTRHIYREANGVAHRLAHIASFSSVEEFWFEETPSIIEDVLFVDCCNRTRG